MNHIWVSQVVPVVKNPSTIAGDGRDIGLISGKGRSPGIETGNPLQYSCLENSMDRGPWQAVVHVGTWGHKESDTIAVLVSGVQQSDSVIHIHGSILILFPFRLLHNIEQSSLCCRVGPY